MLFNKKILYKKGFFSYYTSVAPFDVPPTNIGMLH